MFCLVALVLVSLVQIRNDYRAVSNNRDNQASTQSALAKHYAWLDLPHHKIYQKTNIQILQFPVQEGTIKQLSTKKYPTDNIRRLTPMADERKNGLTAQDAPAQNFIHEFIQEDTAPGGRFAGMQVHTRFPRQRTAPSYLRIEQIFTTRLDKSVSRGIIIMIIIK